MLRHLPESEDSFIAELHRADRLLSTRLEAIDTKLELLLRLDKPWRDVPAPVADVDIVEPSEERAARLVLRVKKLALGWAPIKRLMASPWGKGRLTTIPLPARTLAVVAVLAILGVITAILA